MSAHHRANVWELQKIRSGGRPKIEESIWIIPLCRCRVTMDLCADLMASHMELNDRGWRHDRLALMKQKLLPPNISRHGSVDSINPLSNYPEVELALQHKNNSTPTTPQQPKPTELVDVAITSPSPPQTQPLDNKEGFFFPVCWFIVALGMMSAWTAMMTFLGVFKKLFGPDIFLMMNAAYYGPALPVLILNLTFGKKMDLRCGSYNGYMVRGVGCSAVLGILMAIHPTMAANGGGSTWVLVESFLIGLFGGMAYGCVFSFNAIFSKTCASVFSMGMFAPGFVFMAFQLGTNFSANPKAKVGGVSKAHLHWIIAAVLSFVGVVALIVLLNHPKSRVLLANADKELQEKEEQRLRDVNNGNTGASSDKGGEEDKDKQDESMKAVAKMIGAALVSIFASIFAIVAIVSGWLVVLLADVFLLLFFLRCVVLLLFVPIFFFAPMLWPTLFCCCFSYTALFFFLFGLNGTPRRLILPKSTAMAPWATRFCPWCCFM